MHAQFCSGGTLDAYVRRQEPLPEPTARFFFRQLVTALAFCEQHGVANRDVKLDNCLLDHHSPPWLQLADFGCSRQAVAEAQATAAASSQHGFAAALTARLRFPHARFKTFVGTPVRSQPKLCPHASR